MSVCPGCGRCKECGHPRPVPAPPWHYHQQPYTYPNNDTGWQQTYHIGDPIPGAPGTLTVTC